MKIFKRVEDIDFEWVKERENINYNYQGEFSPLHALEKLERILGM